MEKLEQPEEGKGGGNLVAAFQGITLPRSGEELHTRREKTEYSRPQWSTTARSLHGAGRRQNQKQE
jgi:hypothetical protein